MGDKIFNVLVPKEKKIKVKAGKRQTVEEKIYPGYVLVEMILTEDSWYVVRNTPRVTGFVGPDNTTPTPLSKDEVDMLLARSRASGDESKMIIDLRVGDLVKITDGPFKEYDGKDRGSERRKGQHQSAGSDFRQGYRGRTGFPPSKKSINDRLKNKIY